MRDTGDNFNPTQRNARGLKRNTRFLTPKQKVYAEVFDKVAKLLKETHRIKGTKNKVEERLSLVENTEESDVRCFIN